MNRKEFIKNSLIIGTGLNVLPSFSMGLFQNSYSRNQLIGLGNPDIIGDSYTSKMHKETVIALAKMKTAAALESIRIEVVSAYRSFQRQKEIYEDKYQRYISQGLSPTEAIEKIVEYSTFPERHVTIGEPISTSSTATQHSPKIFFRQDTFTAKGLTAN